MSETTIGEAVAAFQAKDYDKAEALLQRALEANPNDVEARFGLGMIAGTMGHRDVAIDRMRAVLEVDPDHLSALQWLAVLCAEAGRDDDAIAHANRHLELNPHSPQVLDALGRCLVRKTRLSEALICFDRAVALEPHVAILHFNRGLALRLLGRDAAAVQALQTCVGLSPSFEPYLRLAEAELAVGALADAEKSARKAAALRPQDYLGHEVLARVWAEAGRLEDADREWNEAMRLEPEPGRMLADRADTHIAEGRFEEAAIDLRASIERNPNRGAAYRGLVFVKRIGDDDRPTVDAMERLLQQAGLPDADRLDLLYGLGKAYDNLGDYERAIHRYDEANALKLRTELRGRAFDREAFTADIDRRIRQFTKDTFERAAGSANVSEVPLVVVGLLRSGTTLTEQILSCHPDVGAAGEQPFWLDFEHETSSGSPPELDHARVRQLAADYVSVLGMVAPGFPRVVDKNPANSIVTGLIHLALPYAPIIRMQRNLIDIAISTWVTPMHTTAPFVCDRESIVYAFKEVLRLMEHWRTVLPAERYLEVRYEDLVDDPETHTRRMVAHCGLDWSDACLRPELNTRRVKTPSFWQVRRPIYKTSTQRWRNYEPWLGVFRELEGLY